MKGDIRIRLDANLSRLQALSDLIGTAGEAEQEGSQLAPATLQVAGMWMDELLEDTRSIVETEFHTG